MEPGDLPSEGDLGSNNVTTVVTFITAAVALFRLIRPLFRRTKK